MNNLLVSGNVLSMDKYGRARLFIDNKYEINKIISHIKQDTYVKFPFEKNTDNELILILTIKKHKKYYMDKISEYRAKNITVEVSPRKWIMNGNVGISLDIVSIQ